MTVNTWMEAGGRALTPRLQRLRQALDALVNNLREDVALAVGRAVAEAVRAALRHWLGCDRCLNEPHAAGGWHDHRSAIPTRRPGEPAGYGGWQSASSAPAWGESREYPGWPQDDDEEDIDERPYLPQEAPAPEGAKARSWAQAAALACQAGAWCLRRRPSPLVLVAVLGLGLLAALGVGLAGHVVMPAAGMSGSVLALLRLGDLLTALGRVLC